MNNFLFYRLWHAVALLFTSVLRECKNVELSFSDVTGKTDLLKGNKKGNVYLTPYRVKAGIAFILYMLNVASVIESEKLSLNFCKFTWNSLCTRFCLFPHRLVGVCVQ